MFIDKLIILHVKMIVNKNLSINIKFYTGYEKMRLINPHMAPFGAGLKSGMQVCKVKCSFVNRKLNICKRDANVKYLDAFTVALT